MSILVSLLKDLLVRKRPARRPVIAARDERMAASAAPPAARTPASVPAPAPARQALEVGHFETRQREVELCIAHLETVLHGTPDQVDAQFSLGALYEATGRSNEAIACYGKALALNPAHSGAMMARQHLMQQQCAWEGLESASKALRAAVRTASSCVGDISNLIEPFSFLALPGTTAAEQRLCAEQYAATLRDRPEIEAAHGRLGLHYRDRHDDRIRIGYLSYDFFNHATARLMARTFELHDRSRFQINAYSFGPDDGSVMRKRMEKAFDRFVDIAEASPENAARQIHTDGIDILVDLKGYTQDNRREILALRPAPIQVNYLGYPGTMGADFIDYIIADDFVIPPHMEHHYTEQVIRLQDCCQPTDDGRPCPPAPSRTEHGLPEHGFIFCCFNQTYKITPEVFDVWCRLLRAVPDSRLWLWMSTPDAAPNLLREAAARGVTPDRLVMAPTIADTAAHLARLQCADLFLDTLTYNAHTTCSDALWMGLPVLTCPGETFPSRVAGSLLTTMGVPELIAPSLDEYYRLALELATDRRKLESIRRKIVANRDTAPLFDSARFTRNLEHAYVQMMTARRGKART